MNMPLQNEVIYSQVVDKVYSPKNAWMKKDVKSMVAARKWL